MGLNDRPVVLDSSGDKSEHNRKSLKLVLIAGSIITVVIVAALSYGWWFPPEETQTTWHFKGAYASYEGETLYFFMPITFSAKIEIADLNSTHLQSLLHLKVTSNSLGTIIDEQENLWVPINETTSFGFEELDGYTIVSTYEEVYIEGVGTKTCQVYELTTLDVENYGVKMIVYVDPELVWPLKFSVQMNITVANLNVDLNLIDTNIPGFT